MRSGALTRFETHSVHDGTRLPGVWVRRQSICLEQRVACVALVVKFEPEKFSATSRQTKRDKNMTNT
jgi:hypothetical protein